MRVTDGSTVVGDDVRNLVLSKFLLGDLAELEACLLGIDAVGLETTLDVVEDTEVLAGFVDGNNILESKRESVVSSNSVVNLDIATLVPADFEGLLAGEGILQSVAEENCERNALTELMGSCRWTGSVTTA